MHQPNNKEAYDNSPVANLYGIPAEDFNLPTRLIVRDVFLTDESAERLKKARTGLPYTEIKTEVSIDRITSAANPRPLERVPAGATFGPMELIINFYLAEDANLVATLIDGMQLLEGDYLGGGG
ncbi:MAG: type III-A CRISPR-associated RAMP protein Csm3, partial [Phototrophicales bacterium]